MGARFARLMGASLFLLTVPLALTPTSAFAQDSLAESVWTRNAELLSLKVDQYATETGSLSLQLMAFPATEKSASDWLDHAIPLMFAKDKAAGVKVHTLNDDALGPNRVTTAFNSSSDSVDMASRTVAVLRKAKGG